MRRGHGHVGTAARGGLWRAGHPRRRGRQRDHLRLQGGARPAAAAPRQRRLPLKRYGQRLGLRVGARRVGRVWQRHSLRATPHRERRVLARLLHPHRRHPLLSRQVYLSAAPKASASTTSAIDALAFYIRPFLHRGKKKFLLPVKKEQKMPLIGKTE